MSALLISEQTVAHTLTSVASLAVASVSGAMFGGITMMVDDRVGTYAFTDPTCAEIDQAQYGSGRGPCLEAFRSGAVIVVDSLAVDRRFPEFSASAMAHGVRSTLSVPMLAGATSVGALNLYAGVEHAFGDHENQTGRLFAAQAAVVLVNAQAYWGAHLRGEQLQMALQSREPI
ncbi:MAG TPA: GAF domain-containing protein, partial [Ilumatobacteraceae bacterium]